MTINFGSDKPIVHTRDPNDPIDSVLDELGAFDLLSANECDELWWGLRGLSLRELELLKKIIQAKAKRRIESVVTPSVPPQVELDEESKRVLFENLWNLYK